MSQKPDVSTFDIRKLSLFKINNKQENKNASLAASEWFHFPQRSDITINFFKYLTDANSFHISIIWKGNVLDQTYWHQDTNNFISSIGKYPSLGFKIVSPKGELLKRFQVSFNTTDVYDTCCKCVEGKLKVTLNKIDAMATGENSQILDYPSQNNPTSLEGQKLINRRWKNASNNQNCFQPSQTLCGSQYLPTPRQPTSFSQLEKSTLPNVALEQRNLHQFNTSQQVLGVGQLYNNNLLPQYQQPQGYYTLYQPPYAYFQTSPQQSTFNGDLLVQNQNLCMEPWKINCDQEILSHPNPKACLIDRPLNNHLLINGHASQNHTTNESLDCNRPDTNIRSKARRISHNTTDLSERDENKGKPAIKEEEMLPMEIENNIISVRSSSIQKRPKKQESKQKCDLFKMKDDELKRLIGRKLKDKEFINFVERLDKIVSQP